MDKDFKKILSFVFLALAIVLSGEDFKSFSDISPARNDIARYNEENSRLAGTKEKIDRALSFVQKNPEIMTKFDIILPDSGDSWLNFMSALENLASLNGILIDKMDFQKPDIRPEAGATGASVVAADYESDTINMSFTGGYSALKNFLAAIENDLKIADVVHLDFQSAAGNAAGAGKGSSTYEFKATLKTYWQSADNEKRLAAFLNAADSGDFSFTKGKQFTDLVSPPGYSATIDEAVELNNPAPF